VSNSELSLEVSISNDPKVMRLFDTSHYYTDTVLENYLVEVLPVNKSSWVTFHVNKNFSLVLNSSNLQYKKASYSNELVDLQDGIYEIKQSHKPNISTVSHFLYLRTVLLYNDLKSQLCDLITNKCDLSREDFNINRDKLREIEEYINAAKWMVEECGDKVKGKELYDYAKKLLEEYKSECGC
jgi:hypothetical protein